MNSSLGRWQRPLLLAAVWVLLAAFLTLDSAMAQVANSQPAFPSSEDGARSVAENAAAGANVGAPVEATDADNDALTYTLGGDDAASFSIVPSTGQLQTLAALNFEAKSTYSVTVSASDQKDAAGNADTAIDATIDMTISVISVDEPEAVVPSRSQQRVGDGNGALPGVIVPATTLALDEGASGGYTVALNAQPTSNVVITVTSDNADVTVSPTTLTFTRTNWSAAQIVTLSAAQDEDAVDDAASIAHAVVAADSADAYDAVSIAGLAVSIADDDARVALQSAATPGVTVSATTLTVVEGSSATYTVVLNVRPSSNVVISVTKSGSADVTLDTDAETSGNQDKLTFTTNTWSAAQTVTVSAAEDDDAVNDAASIAHAVVAADSAAEYDSVTIAGVVVTIDDDDIAGVDVPSEITGMLEGSGALYKVRLNAQPTSDVVISVAKSGSSSLTVSPARLTFTRAN